MIIDSHQHAYYHGFNPAGVIAEMDQFGIDVTWLLTWYHPPAEHAPGSSRAFNPCNIRPDGTHAGATLGELLDARDCHPDRFIAGYCPCPSEGDAPALFEAAYHMHGVRVCGEWSYRMLLDDPRALELFHKAGELKCPVVLHLDVPYLPDENGKQVYQTYWYGGGAAPLERTLQACPDTVFIGHAPVSGGISAGMLRQIQRHTRVDRLPPAVKYSVFSIPILTSGQICLLDLDWVRCSEM